MQELIKTTSTPAVLNVNFEELKKHLAAELEKYEILVTAETLPDAKKLCTELNKTAAEIDTRRKFEVAAVSEPIKHFDANMKKLVTMCKDGRTLILDQVKKFEDETRKLAFKLLEKYRAEMFEKYQVEQEFFRCEFDDLIKLSSVTGKGKLAGSAKKELEMRVLADKSIQDRTKNRLLMLENASLKAGLVATLTKDHVKHFLFAEDFKYESELERILGVEVAKSQFPQIDFFQQDINKELPEQYNIMKDIFPITDVMAIAVPTYVGGFFTLLVGSKTIDMAKLDLSQIEEKYKQLNLNTKYYKSTGNDSTGSNVP